MTSAPEDDSDLRRLLNDAVSEVHPEGGTEQIRARARRSSAGRWMPLTVAAAVATVAVIGGAAWLAQRQPLGRSAAGSGSVSDANAPTGVRDSPTPTHLIDAQVYVLGSTAVGPRLFVEQKQIRTAADSSDLQTVVDETLTAKPADPDYENPFRDLGLTARATLEGGVVTIDLSSAPARPPGMNGGAARMAVQSLVWSADTAGSVTGPVRFTVAGAAADNVLGVSTSAPVERAGSDSVMSTVSITSPLEGSNVSNQFEVTGQAATFEANVVWELKQGEKVVRNGYTTATECCTLSPYRFMVTAAPGEYTLVVHDTDESDGEGVGTSEDTKRITVE
ncbi:MAG: Gmad2 immunoglobulin-like domain-containing protein [Marmoricola sp.]